ncbi:hypothetical protein D3C80_967290 [compost metagenome]
MIGLLQAEGLVGILLAPLHELVAVEAVVIPVKGPVGLDKPYGFLRFHVWPPGTVRFPSRLASRGDLRGLIGQILDLWQLAKGRPKGGQQDSRSRCSRTSDYAALIKPTALKPSTGMSHGQKDGCPSFLFIVNKVGSPVLTQFCHLR